MKVINKILKAHEEGRPYWSFEYFPPKTQQGVQNLYDRMERMYRLGPEFIDVTWNAGGTSSQLTSEIVATAQSVYGLETVMHLTCTNMPKEKIDKALKDAKECGCQNILALRGDPPRGQEHWEACENGFSHAIDLVRYIRQQYGDYFGIAVAGYCEGHVDNPDKDDDLYRLKEKVDAGADFIITQVFYDVDLFLKWVKKCRAIGISCPIIPGILPIQNYSGFNRIITLSKTIVPQFVLEELEPIKDDDAAVKEYGIKLATDMIRKMFADGIKGYHFYTMNLERSTRIILETLEFVPPVENVKPLPWCPSLSAKRKKENVRPIFWRNRTKSYIARTEAWDEFPNGRWGDSRSPAFGELDGYGVSLKHSKKEALALWGYPQKLSNIFDVFVQYCRGEVNSLPWSDLALAEESDIIREQLAHINSLGYLTINSQPAVNGVRSDHKIFGWGPKNGYVYQKAYLEIFISPTQLDALIARIESDSNITYYAVNKQGDLKTNTQSDGPNAVTWGVFPGKEIIQPTIVEAVSFMAWKDEAFELWNEWAKIYDTDSISAKLITDIAENWYLINIVHNDFHDNDGIFKIFEQINVADYEADR
ncbi:methylenetetrahydrofolate reductase-domain-containing protein [Glomus cerebriforme]|uniref:Methylenetetrahydrofolate reductase-domain-containing protein n=1 Tax=Glomus cerebriforme TaxID=658196 RepID=A0A397T3T7_9GLOM|nr:methylenetetrahydrofolate reductase-domain-containing protein [Glomus cerebriforme]